MKKLKQINIYTKLVSQLNFLNRYTVFPGTAFRLPCAPKVDNSISISQGANFNYRKLHLATRMHTKLSMMYVFLRKINLIYLLSVWFKNKHN